eukprot:COSAG05_NODE_923_length_6573_cov_168.011725_3_plen_83_part_00
MEQVRSHLLRRADALEEEENQSDGDGGNSGSDEVRVQLVRQLLELGCCAHSSALPHMAVASGAKAGVKAVMGKNRALPSYPG